MRKLLPFSLYLINAFVSFNTESAMAENELKRDRLSKQVEELHREIEQLKAARTKGQNGPSNEFIEKLKSFESENVVLRKDISALKEKAENDHHLIKDLERQVHIPDICHFHSVLSAKVQ